MSNVGLIRSGGGGVRFIQMRSLKRGGKPHFINSSPIRIRYSVFDSSQKQTEILPKLFNEIFSKPTLLHRRSRTPET